MQKHSVWTLGITGGIASGKSTVTDYFAQRGALIVDSDVISRALTAPGGAAIPQIREKFGYEFISDSGAMDRAKMRALVFSSDSARKTLEGIIHPMVRTEMTRMLSSCPAAAPFAVAAIPLLPSLLSFRNSLSRVLVTDAPEENQISRLRSRNGFSRETALSVIRKQASRREMILAADDVLFNGGDLQSLLSAAETLFCRYAAESESAGAALR